MIKIWQKLNKKDDSYVFYSLSKAIRNKIIFNNVSLLKSNPKELRNFGHKGSLIEKAFHHYFMVQADMKTSLNNNLIITITEYNAPLIDLIIASESSLDIGKMFLMIAVSDKGLSSSKIVSRVLQDQDAVSKRFNAMYHEHFYAYPFYNKLLWGDFRQYFINLDKFNEDLYYIPMFLEDTGSENYGEFIDKMDAGVSPFFLNEPKYLTLLLNMIDILKECDFLSNRAKHFTKYDFGSLFNLAMEIQSYSAHYGRGDKNHLLLSLLHTVIDDKVLSVWEVDHLIKDRLYIESKKPDYSIMEKNTIFIALVDLYTRLSSEFKDNDFYDLCMNADSEAFSSEVNLRKIEQYFKEPRTMSFEMWVNLVLLDK